MSSEQCPTLTRDQAIEMLHLAIGFIKKGKTDLAINQLYFMIDDLEVAVAMDGMQLAREAGCSEHFLCQ